MLPDELRQLAARYVPGTGQIAIHRLGGGLVNETYRVLRDGETYALRVTAANPFGLGVDREWEVRVLELAAAADLAPVVEYFDLERGTLLSRWQAGRTWTPAEVRQPENISRMAQLMRRIHALPLPSPTRFMSPAKWIEYYSVGAGEGGTAALRPAASRQLAALAELPKTAPVLCHSDVHALNSIDRGDSLILLDWEYAHASDPLWDVAGWSANNDFEESLGHDLLQLYLGRTPSGEEFLRLRLLGWLYDYVCLLWSELYLYLDRAGRPGVSDQDAVAGRARQLRTRLMHQSGRAS